MRLLTQQEINQVGGGFVPVVLFGAALVSKAVGGGGLAGWAASSIGLVGSTYYMGAYFQSRMIE